MGDPLLSIKTTINKPTGHRSRKTGVDLDSKLSDQRFGSRTLKRNKEIRHPQGHEPRVRTEKESK